MATCIIIQATGSNAGKTFICGCLCKIAKNMGISVVPFKAQNMCNTLVKSQGKIGQINVAQWIQSLSSDQLPFVKFNTFLVNPIGEKFCQLNIESEIAKFKYIYPGSRRLKARMRIEILRAIAYLVNRNDLVIIEGAGAICEVNLKVFDISSVWLTKVIKNNTILIADMERGGALASIIGTHCLLSSFDKRMIIGFLLNKFIGKSLLLASGFHALERITSWSCLGIIPWIADALKLPWEDTLCKRRDSFNEGSIAIVIDIPFGNGVNELNALNLELNLNVLLLKNAPVWIPVDLKLVVIPDSYFAVKTLINVCKTSWPDFLIRARAHGVLIIGIGVGFLILTLSFSHQSKAIWASFRTFDTNILCLKTPLYSLHCDCKLLDVKLNVSTSLYAPYIQLSNDIFSKYETLLECNKICYGVYCSNIWGFAVNGIFENDRFRLALMYFIGVKPSYLSYKTYLNTFIANAALKVGDCIGINLSQLLGL